MPSHEVYLSYDLSVGYKTSRLVGNMLSGEPIDFCEEWHMYPYFNHGTIIRIIIKLVSFHALIRHAFLGKI